jgi:hypothetical protein
LHSIINDLTHAYFNNTNALFAQSGQDLSDLSDVARKLQSNIMPPQEQGGNLHMQQYDPLYANYLAFYFIHPYRMHCLDSNA